MLCFYQGVSGFSNEAWCITGAQERSMLPSQHPAMMGDCGLLSLPEEEGSILFGSLGSEE